MKKEVPEKGEDVGEEKNESNSLNRFVILSLHF